VRCHLFNPASNFVCWILAAGDDDNRGRPIIRIEILMSRGIGFAELGWPEAREHYAELGIMFR
jgi:hypothetical protein